MAPRRGDDRRWTQRSTCEGFGSGGEGFGSFLLQEGLELYCWHRWRLAAERIFTPNFLWSALGAGRCRRLRRRCPERA